MNTNTEIEYTKPCAVLCLFLFKRFDTSSNSGALIYTFVFGGVWCIIFHCFPYKEVRRKQTDSGVSNEYMQRFAEQSELYDNLTTLHFQVAVALNIYSQG